MASVVAKDNREYPAKCIERSADSQSSHALTQTVSSVPNWVTFFVAPTLTVSNKTTLYRRDGSSLDSVVSGFQSPSSHFSKPRQSLHLDSFKVCTFMHASVFSSGNGLTFD